MKSKSCLLRLKMQFLHISFFLVIFVLVPSLCCFAGGTVQPVAKPDAVNLVIKKHYRLGQDGNYTQTLYFKTLINTYKGQKDRGDFKFGYNSAFEKVTVKLARTILPDGRVVKVGPKEINDITDPSTQKASIFSGARMKIVNFPAVEKGCIIELEMEKQSKLPFFAMESFRLADPTREKSVVIDMPRDQSLSFRLAFKGVRFSEKTSNGRRVLEWTGRGLEKDPDDPLSPPLENLDHTLVVSQFASWTEVSQWFTHILLDNLNRQNWPGLSHGFKSATDADGLYCLLENRLKILPLNLFKTKLVFQAPVKTRESGYGTQFDAAVLFYALLKAKGLSPELLAASSRGVWMKGLENVFYPGCLDTVLVKADGRYYSFDRKELSPGITGMHGQLALSLSSGRFEVIKDSRESGKALFYTVKIVDPSDCEYTYSSTLSGTTAQEIRRMFKYLTPGEFQVRSSMFFHSLHPLARPVGDLEISSLQPLAGPVKIKAVYSVNDFHIASGGGFVVPVPRSSGLDAIASCLSGRKDPVFIRSNKSSQVVFDISMPDSYQLLGFPQGFSGRLGPVSWQNSCNATGMNIHCVRRITVKRGFVENGEEFARLKQVVFRLLDPEENSIRFLPAD
ncbi:MAG: hypothetical protein DSZ23_01290 [Thermodesulfatator sp.]|nr:MAG: hypothetical protein DSZ23_01290 [Thermodesulfatator sp.]